MALTALGMPGAALSQTVVFDFETAPDSDDPVEGDGINPVFIDPVTGFTMWHAAGAVRGEAQWTNDIRSEPYGLGSGSMRVSDVGLGATPVTATIHFSEPVSFVRLWAKSAAPATITPILEGGGLGPPVAVSASYGQIFFNGDDSYEGLELSADAVNNLYWDDLEVSLGIVKPRRHGLYAASRPSGASGLGPPFRLHAVDNSNGTGRVIGSTDVALSGLAREPSTGIIYGLNALDSTPTRLFEVDGRTAELSGGYPVVVAATSPLQLQAGEFIIGVFGADFAPDGTLYGALSGWIDDDETAGFSPGDTNTAYFTRFSTAPVGGNIEVELLDTFPEKVVTGVSIHPDDGTLWTVSPANVADFGGSMPNMLREYDISGGTLVLENGPFTLQDAVSNPPPGAGFAGLQFTCEPGVPVTLYAGNLEGASGNDGGQVFTVDTSTGLITLVGSVAGATGGRAINSFAPATSCGVTNIENAPTAAGNNITVISTEGFEQEAFEVDLEGLTSATFCAAPDPREITLWGRWSIFVPVFLDVANLSNTGTCGDLSHIDMRVPPWHRGYSGTVTIDDVEVSDVYLVVAAVETTAQYDGPVVTLPVPEAIVDFDGFDSLAELCGHPDLGLRPLDVAAAVPALGDYPNVEDDRGIVTTAQCNRPGSMTRRTTHVYPVRIDRRFNEAVNLLTQTNGIRRTIREALVVCTAPPPELSSMEGSLNAALVAIAQGTRFWRPDRDRLIDAVLLFEQIAFDAKAADFSSCPAGSNYRGNFMSRGISTGYTVFDRLYNPDPWRPYLIPEGLEIPLLQTRPDGTLP